MSDDNLNTEIARLMGWRQSPEIKWLHGSEWLDNGWVSPAAIADGNALWGKKNCPDYSGDRGAALRLLEHVLRQTLDGKQFSVTELRQGQDAWYVVLYLLRPHGLRTRIQVTGESVGLAEAIALACRDALVALRCVDAGDGQTGETP